MQGLVVRFAETEEQKQARLRRTGLLPTAPVIPNYGGLATPSPATPVSPAAQYSYAHAQYQQQCMQLNAYSNYGAALSAAAGSYTVFDFINIIFFFFQFRNIFLINYIISE
jgi:hypothetical protein